MLNVSLQPLIKNKEDFLFFFMERASYLLVLLSFKMQILEQNKILITRKEKLNINVIYIAIL